MAGKSIGIFFSKFVIQSGKKCLKSKLHRLRLWLYDAHDGDGDDDGMLISGLVPFPIC